MSVTRRAVKRFVANGYAELRQELRVFGPTQDIKDDSQYGKR